MKTLEGDLVGRAVAGDESALVSLLQRCGRAVRGSLFVPRRWQSMVSADDVMQQTYVDAFRAIGEFAASSEKAFATWLTRIAKRNLADAIRMLATTKRGGDRARVDPRSANGSFVGLCQMLSASISSPSRRTTYDEVMEALERAIEALPETHRLVVRLYDLEGRPVEEVARQLKRTPGAVFMVRARAHRLLGDMMGAASEYLSVLR